jgi:predicted DNA-binding transcriptional regulator AlpA
MSILNNSVSFDTLPEAVQTILEQVQELNQKIDNLPLSVQEQSDENRFVSIDEIRQTVFPQWKKQTIYNKCSLGELPHSRIGSRLLFNLKECREWRDSQLQKGKIKSNAQIEDEAQAFFDSQKKGGTK